MSTYTPGPANLAHVEKDGDSWTLVLVRELKHAPEKVWSALIDPEQLREWSPFDADASLGATGNKAKLTTIGAPAEYATSETVVTNADAPHELVYNWGGFDMRWLLEAVGEGTRLTLWTTIDRRYMAMGAAGWQICFDVLDHLLEGNPLGRMAGPTTMDMDGWKRLTKEYAVQFGAGE